MNKFKVGDRVKIIYPKGMEGYDANRLTRRLNFGIHPNMLKYIGTLSVIVAEQYHDYFLNECRCTYNESGFWSWPESMLELVDREKVKIKISDLL